VNFSKLLFLLKTFLISC